MVNLKKVMTRRGRIIASVIIVILVMVGAWLLVSHKDTVLNSVTSQTVSRICSDDIVKSYNTIESDVNVPVPNYKPVYDKINAKRDWNNDANCVYIALQYAIYGQDVTTSRRLFDQLNKLDDQGLSVSNTLAGVQSRAALQQTVDYLSQAGSSNNAAGRGL